MPTPPTNLMDVPVEVLQRILTYVRPQDVAAFSQTSRAAYHVIYQPHDRHLWLELYLAYPLDHPDVLQRQSAALESSEARIATADELKSRLIEVCKAERAATAPIGSLTEEEEATAVRTFHSFLTSLPVYRPLEDGKSVEPSLNGEWLERTLARSRLLSNPKPAWEARSASLKGDSVEMQKARLRCCLRSSFRDDDEDTDPFKERAYAIRRNQSRCFTYDLRHYSDKTRWGPFTESNGVNWAHVGHLMNVVWENLCGVPLAEAIRPQIGVEATRAHSAIGNYSTGDWAGVEGTWTRVICFMDHRDLFAFNIRNEMTDNLNEYIFEDASFREATRVLEVKLLLIDPSEMKGIRFRLPQHVQEDTKYPPIYFKGSSRGPGGIDSVIKGVVYREEDGSVRWRFVREAVHDLSPQWTSNGVQIGDIGSAIGVVGVWTTAEHDDGDPVGPFWLFKNEAETPTRVIDYM